MSNYNGWKNWETWNYKLWMDEDGEMSWVVDMIHEHKMDVDNLAEMLSNRAWERHDEMYQESSFFSDVSSNAIRVIDFNEIAESIMESVQVA